MPEFGLHSALALMWVPLYLFLAAYYAVFTGRERYNLSFAFLWALMAVYAFGCAGLYASSGPEQGVLWQRVSLLSAAFAFPTILVFAAAFAGGGLSRRAVAALYSISTGFGISIFATPWFFTTIPADRAFSVWGLAVRYPEMKPGWLGEVCFAWGLLLLLASLGLLARAAWRGRRGALLLASGLAIILVCALNDILVASAGVEFFYLTEHGYAVYAIAAAFFMLDRFLLARRELEKQSRRLLAANRDLQGLDSMKEDLLANISHELRTPLVSIRGYAEIMLEGRLGPITGEQASGLKVALRNVERLLGLIANLLDYAKLRDGRVKLERKVIDVKDVLRESIEAALPQIEESGLTLVESISQEERLAVRGDAGMLRQVFDNLLSNAIKFTPSGREIRAELNRSEEGWIRAAVEDDGIGIPADEMARIFERFYQVGPTGQSTERGMSSAGVGLAIVREIVRLHLGDVSVQSRPEQGSRFEIRLPKAATTEDLERPPAAAVQDHPHRARLLLVDDDREVIEFLTLAMSGEGYDVEVAKDGVTALERAQASRFDAMLLDLTMAGMGGEEVLERLRADPATATLPVIIVTALAGEEIRRKCLAAGADDFVLKPVAVQALRRVVKRVLTRTPVPGLDSTPRNQRSLAGSEADRDE